MKDNKNFGFTHKCGILLPISSLPSKYGIGSFGKEAYEFVDFLADTHQKCWQVLPLNPTSYGDSPYQSPASIAGNPYFIDLPTLYSEGLLTADELAESEHDTQRVDYGWLFNTRYAVLRKAYSRFTGGKRYDSFCAKNAAWLDDYALFMALKGYYNYRAWTEWGAEHRDYEKAKKWAADFVDDIGFWKWVQYAFMSQWKALLKYAHSKKIVIIGDMPIYVAHDSMDVWRNTKQFLLDENFNPTVVAGCPPDGFSPDGQLWGNPIYNWELMKAENFAWWCERVGAAFELYDILRIDHFRGFASFYSIPYGDKTAHRGSWVSAPGKELFAAIRAAHPKAKIIAEDLGFITDDVRELLAFTGFPGMKILQFAYFEENGEYLPRMYTTDNCVVYPGSHDSDCTATWCKNLSGEIKERFIRCTHRRVGQSATCAVIESAMRSRANLAVVAMQDYLELENDEARMNTPSLAEGNWQWRLKKNYKRRSVKEKIAEIATSTHRA